MLSTIKVILLTLISILTNNIATYANNHPYINNNSITLNNSDSLIKIKSYLALESSYNSQTQLQDLEQKGLLSKEPLSLYNDATIYIELSKYNNIRNIQSGANITLVPTINRQLGSVYNGSHIFITSIFGRIELGLPTPAAKNMMISYGSIPTKYIKTNTVYLKQDTKESPSFLTSSGCFLGNTLRTNLSTTPYNNQLLRTINYYTPKLMLKNKHNIIQIGISYTPDTSNTRLGSLRTKSNDIQKKIFNNQEIEKFEIDQSVSNIITTGLILEQQCYNNILFKLALTGEYAKSPGILKTYLHREDTNPEIYRLFNLKSFNIGGELKNNHYIYSACYGSFNNSLTTPILYVSSCNAKYYSLGISYQYDKKTTTKMLYFGSEQFTNKINSIKFHVNHVLEPGIQVYLELSSYQLTGQPEFYNQLKCRLSHGIVSLFGIRLTL